MSEEKDDAKPKASFLTDALEEDAERAQDLVKRFANGNNADEFFALIIGDYKLFKAIKEGDIKLVEAIKQKYKVSEELQARRAKEDLERVVLDDTTSKTKFATMAKEDRIFAEKMDKDFKDFQKAKKAIDDEADLDLANKRAEVKIFKDTGLYDDALLKDYDEFLVEKAEVTKLLAREAYGTLDKAAIKDMAERIALANMWKKYEARILSEEQGQKTLH